MRYSIIKRLERLTQDFTAPVKLQPTNLLSESPREPIDPSTFGEIGMFRLNWLGN